jgi:tRNA(Ile)-lysidine synthase
MESFVQDIADALDSRLCVKRGDAIVVGVSGGLDSVVLLHALRELTSQAGREYRLTTAHLNHCLRDSADADEQFVRHLADSWQISCCAARKDVHREAQRLGQGIEQAARMLRYQFLEDVAREQGAKFVAVAHHADDNVETILYRVLRGTHLRGLAGIPETRRLPGGATLIRPLLKFTRSQIESYAKNAGLEWREDPTNADATYRRNLLRHEILPLLREKLNPRADDALLRLAEAADDVEQLLASQAESAMQRCLRLCAGGKILFSAELLAREPAVLRSYVLRLALERLGAPLRMLGAERFAELARLVEPGGAAAMNLPGGFAVRREAGELVLEKTAAPVAGNDAVVELSCPGVTPLPDGRRIVCEVLTYDENIFAQHRDNHPRGVELIDADGLHGSLVCRNRRDGDAFVPLGSPGRTSVSDFLTNAKIPREDRSLVRCVCDDSGIVYVLPLRIDDRVKITPATRRMLRLSVEFPG